MKRIEKIALIMEHSNKLVKNEAKFMELLEDKIENIGEKQRIELDEFERQAIDTIYDRVCRDEKDGHREYVYSKRDFESVL